MIAEEIYLGELTRIRTGKLDANASSDDGAYPFFTCAREPLRINDFSYDCECVLVAGNGDLNVKYYEGKFDAYQRTYIIEVLPESLHRLHLRYAYHFLETYLDKLRAQSIGGIIKYIKLGNLTQAKIPLPSLQEQKRIATILDKADELRAKRREAIAELDKLVQATFLDMFCSGSMHMTALDNLCELITDGTHQTPTYADSGYKFLSSKDVKSGRIDWSNIKYIPADLHEQLYSRLAPRRGDILLAKNGTTGVAALVDTDEIFDIYVSLALLRPTSEVIPKYLLGAVNSPYTKRQFDRSLKGVGVPNLHLKEIRKVLIPHPPIEYQLRFAKAVDSLTAHRNLFERHLGILDSLFASLQHRAFNGEL